MQAITLHRAGPQDAVRLNAALRALSRSMGDVHRAGDRQIEWALGRAFEAILAESEGDDLKGVAVFSPLFSTTRGIAGAYVSDLWVSPQARGAGLGQRLLAAVRDEAAREWGAGFLRLTVYADNKTARRFYARLGFAEHAGEHHLTLSVPALSALKGER